MDLSYFKQWVKKEFKIDLTAYKETQLHRRLLNLMSRVGVSNVNEYIKLLEKDSVQRQKFLDFITINVTEFFRNPEIFDEFEGVLKKEVMRAGNNIKIWSAACSVGAEPYSIAMILQNSMRQGNFKIVATDIDSTILRKAQEGVYSGNEVRNVKKSYLDKFFRLEGNKYIIDESIKRNVTFKKHDLILDRYESDFDVIVCRNVVIYFNQDIKDKIYEKFARSLKKGGLLFVGATESIYNYKSFGFEKASTFIYRKV